jgi:hypothetical protein
VHKLKQSQGLEGKLKKFVRREEKALLELLSKIKY